MGDDVRALSVSEKIKLMDERVRGGGGRIFTAPSDDPEFLAKARDWTAQQLAAGSDGDTDADLCDAFIAGAQRVLRSVLEPDENEVSQLIAWFSRHLDVALSHVGEGASDD